MQSDLNEAGIPAADRQRVPLANFIREWRAFRNMTQEELADQAGLSRLTVNQMESGLMPYSQRALGKLAPVLGCRPGDLLTLNPLDPKPIEQMNRLAAMLAEFHDARNN